MKKIIENLFVGLGLLLPAILFTPVSNASSIGVLLETDVNVNSNDELAVVGFNSMGDLILNTGGIGSPSAWDIPVGFSTTGITYDGNKYHVLLEADNDFSGTGELAVISFNSMGDLILNTGGIGSPSAWDIPGRLSTRGFYSDSSAVSTPVPEPATMILFGIGLLGLAGVSRRKKT